MLEKLRLFFNYPSGSGLMFFVLLNVCIFNICSLTECKAENVYNKNWVNLSAKNWGDGNPAFSYFHVDNNGNANGEYWRRYYFECSKPCFVVGVQKHTDGTNPNNPDYIIAYAITTKTGEVNETSPFLWAQQYENESFNMHTEGNGNFNMANAFSDWYTAFPEWNNQDYWVHQIYSTQLVKSGQIENCQYDYLFETADELREFLDENNFNPPKPTSSTKDPYFYLKVTSPAIAQNIEYTITWETAGSYAEGKEGDYGIQVYLAQRNNNSGFGNMNFSEKDAIKNSDTYPFWLNQIAFTFTYGDLNKLIKWYQNASFLDNSFFIFLRVVDVNNQPVNAKWYSFHIVKKYEITSSQSYTEGQDGELSEPDNLTSYDDGTMQYEDGRPEGDNLNQDGEQNSNGSSVSPSASEEGINNYDPTNPDEANFSYGGTINNLFQNLQELVLGIQNIPSIMGTLLSFLPSWLLTLIAVSIGLFVVVGTIKLIVK